MLAHPFALALSLSLAAQQYAVIPTSAANTDANTGGRVAGFVSRSRQQVLIDRSELGAVRNREITALSLRRNGQYLPALQGGPAHLRVTLSTTVREPRDASPLFAENHGAVRTVVFDSTVQLPNAPALLDRDAADWSAQHAVNIPVVPPFPYGDGTLVVEIEGAPGTNPSPWWPVDFTSDLEQGTTRAFGARCGRYASLSAPASALRLGSTVRIAATGEPDTAGVMILGASDFLPGINLGFLGAPACELLVQPAVIVPTTYCGYAPDVTAPGFAGVHLHLPSQANLLRSSFFAQAVDLVMEAPGHLTTTHGLALAVAALAPRAQCALVESFVTRSGALPTSGLVQPGRMPVVRFSLR